MTVALLLWVLATIDAACCGYRAVAGRSAIIHKTAYYRAAMLRGAAFGQGAVLIAGLASVILLLSAGDSELLWKDMLSAGRAMLFVYLPYAGLVLVTLALRIIPSVDLRSILSVLVFGPFTLIRPAAAIAGVAWAIFTVRRWEVIVLGVVVLVLMLALEPLLERLPVTGETV